MLRKFVPDANGGSLSSRSGERSLRRYQRRRRSNPARSGGGGGHEGAGHRHLPSKAEGCEPLSRRAFHLRHFTVRPGKGAHLPNIPRRNLAATMGFGRSSSRARPRECGAPRPGSAPAACPSICQRTLIRRIMEIKEIVKEKYGQAALRVTTGGSSCCGASASLDGCSVDPITSNLYDANQTGQIPQEAVLASLGCGNPTALAQLNAGETVLDLGSGGGIDVLLSARRVGPSGKAYGLDMTDEMLALARENQRKAGIENVEFLKGEIEDIPLPDNSVDVIISNCVINLSGDKDRVLM